MKKFSMIIAVVIMALMLVNPVLASKPGELLIWADETRSRVLVDLGDQFADEYGIKVVVQEMPFGDIRDQMGVVAPAGEGPDIIVGAHDWLGQLVMDGLIEPLDITDESLFVESALDVFTWAGERYGMPYALESIGLFYNKALVDKAPDSFEDLIAVGKELSAEGKYGLVMPQPDPYHTFPLFSAAGGYVFGEDENGVLNPLDVGLNNEGAVKGLTLFKRLLDEGVMPRAIDYQTMMSLFTGGEAAFMITGPWAFADVRAAGIDYGFTRIPAIDGQYGRPFVGSQGFMVSAFSQNKMLANIFLNEFVGTKESMLELFNRDPRPSAFIPAGDVINQDPDMLGVIEAASQGVPMPSIPAMSAVWEAWSDALELIINQQSDNPQEALDNSVARIIQTIEASQN